MPQSSIDVTSLVSWHVLVEAVQRLVERNMIGDRAAMFTIWDAERLESAAAAVRWGLANLEKHAANTRQARPAAVIGEQT